MSDGMLTSEWIWSKSYPVILARYIFPDKMSYLRVASEREINLQVSQTLKELFEVMDFQDLISFLQTANNPT